MQAAKCSAIAVLAAALGLSGCATTSMQTAASASYTSSPASPSSDTAASGPQRDLTAQEKQVIVDAVALSLRDPKSAKYRWAKIPAVVTDDSINYCAMVNAKSPHAEYNGEQAYIVEAKMSGNRISSAVMGLIAGGKDRAIVVNMCAKYGLDPNKSS